MTRKQLKSNGIVKTRIESLGKLKYRESSTMRLIRETLEENGYTLQTVDPFFASCISTSVVRSDVDERNYVRHDKVIRPESGVSLFLTKDFVYGEVNLISSTLFLSCNAGCHSCVVIGTLFRTKMLKMLNDKGWPARAVTLCSKCFSVTLTKKTFDKERFLSYLKKYEGIITHGKNARPLE